MTAKQRPDLVGKVGRVQLEDEAEQGHFEFEVISAEEDEIGNIDIQILTDSNKKFWIEFDEEIKLRDKEGTK
ncbi:hypothetical protein [Paenibacillus sp. Marseille-Q4541]|uniref:hypothetical protein n=1 Tax=Paenibacillus sp. Marseille-Q4541 TaxID=2831522 RepID=UPI001BAAFAE7|nr:hypothetical protein [Paenibacillus sp. Marseille-Q4541]